MRDRLSRPRNDPTPTDLRKLKPRSRCVAREINKLQGPNAPTLLIPRVSFQKLVREIMTHDLGKGSLKFQSDALVVLQECAEWHITDLMAKAVKLTSHRKRVTLTSEDVKLVMELSK